MLGYLRGACAAFAVACASACATAPAVPPRPLSGATLAVSATAAPPPAGLIALCRRAPAACGQEAARHAAQGRSGFHLALLAHTTDNAAPRAQLAPLTPERWRLLVDVNAEINFAIRYMSDQRRWGEAERWSLPLTFGERGAAGDCEDYALEKRHALIAAGWPVEDLSLATAIAPRYGMHAVLIAHTAQGDFVLDNFAHAPTPLAQAPYRWLTAQRGGDLMRWYGVGAVRAPPRNVAAGFD